MFHIDLQVSRLTQNAGESSVVEKNIGLNFCLQYSVPEIRNDPEITIIHHALIVVNLVMLPESSK